MSITSHHSNDGWCHSLTSQKICRGFLYGVYSPGNDFELTPTTKVKTRNPIESNFDSEFQAICNHCGVMATWSRKTLKCCEKCLRFFGKTTPSGKIFKILFRKFSSRHRSTCCVKFREIWPTGNRWNRALTYLTKQQNFGWLYSCRYCADRAQNLPWPAPDNVFRVLKISFKSIHVRRSYSRTREHRHDAP